MAASSTASDPLAPFLPPVRAWFQAALGDPTPPQAMGWPAIRAGKNALVVAPTGSGKTLTAFLWGLNDLWSRALQGEDMGGVQMVYVSPLRALGNDIHRNLEMPLAGVEREADRMGTALPELRRAVRSGDTPPQERRAMVRRPPHILITTPESLYLMLTARQTRGILSNVRTVIVDEVHALMESKRGVHLTLSLERLEALVGRPLQRIGLSATVRPLEEAAHFLGGQAGMESGSAPVFRPVEIVDAGGRKDMDLAVVSPVQDFRDLPGDSVWPSLARKVLDMVGDHRSTLVFVNDRTQAERVTSLLNELAPEELAQSHHGSLSRERRLQVEQALKRGELPALVATSSLELGIDIGAVDLVVQISSPASVARGLQRVGRAGHLLDRTSVGRIVPKHRRDVLECAAVAREMLRREVEPLRVPRNCLDVLAQQMTAMVAVDQWAVDDLLALARRAYPYRDLSRAQLESVLSMLAGRFPAEEFSGLRPRVFWDQRDGVVRGLPNAMTLAVTSGGTIPERGYYPVILAGEGVRLGELDEEMVFESRIGDVFLLGSAAWRIADIRANQVSVAPAPGEPARMPFWHGEGLGRPYELGRKIGAFVRDVQGRLQDPDLLRWLREECALDEPSALNLRALLLDQQEASGGVLPTDETLVLEAFRDQLGDLRLLLHSPFGRRVHGPWALALAARMRAFLGVTVGVSYNDDGIQFRLPQADAPPPLETFLGVDSRAVRDLVLQELSGAALFAAAFREAAERSLVLRKADPGRRTPLWLQRLRASDLLEVARRYPDFPLIAEAYRECLEDYFDLPRLRQLLRAIEKGDVRIAYVQTERPTPFAAGHLYSFIASYLYEGDAPRAERYSNLLTLNRDLLKDVLGEGGLRELFQPDALREVEDVFQRRAPGWRARTPDEIVDLLLRLGDLSDTELAQRVDGDAGSLIGTLSVAGRVRQIAVPAADGGARLWIAAEESGLYVAALSLSLDAQTAPSGGPTSADGARDVVVRRYARTHGPFQVEDIVQRYGLSPGDVAHSLLRLEAEGRVVMGEFTPDRTGPEWCDLEVLSQVHRRSLSLLRKEAEPSPPEAYSAFLQRWQGLIGAGGPESGAAGLGLDTLRGVVRQLQGLPLPAALWEREVFPARVVGYRPDLLDRLIASGEVVWVGHGGPAPQGRRVSFYLRADAPHLLPLADAQPSSEAQRTVHAALATRGALFLADLESVTGLAPLEVARAVWELAWQGLVTNDGFTPVRSFSGLPSTPSHDDGRSGAAPLGRRPPRWLRRDVAARIVDAGTAASGRWSLVPAVDEESAERVPAWAGLLVRRHGVVAHETLAGEPFAPPWSALLEEWKHLEAAGHLRRGYYLTGLSGLQFAAPDAVEDLRHAARDRGRGPDRTGRPRLLALLDPACPFGTVYPVPGPGGGRLLLHRTVGAYLMTWNGVPVLAVEGAGRVLVPVRPLTQEEMREALRTLASLVMPGADGARPRARLVVERWGEEAVARSAIAAVLEDLGFQPEPGGHVLWGYQAEQMAKGPR